LIGWRQDDRSVFESGNGDFETDGVAVAASFDGHGLWWKRHLVGSRLPLWERALKIGLGPLSKRFWAMSIGSALAIHGK
jgi:hypothetical protein